MLLVAIGLIIATAPLGVMGVGMLRAAKERMLAERLALTRATVEHLNWRLARSWEQLEALSRLIIPLWRAGDLDAMRAAVVAVVPQLTLFTGGVFLVDSTGRLAFQEPAEPALSLPAAALSSSMRKTLAEGRPAVSGLVRTTTGTPVVIFTVPVSQVADAPGGALGGVLSLTDETLQAFVRGMAIGVSGHAVIVNEDGLILASTDPAELFTYEEHPEFFVELIRGRRALVGSTEKTIGPTGSTETHVMAFAPLDAVPWGLAVGQNEEETFGPIRRLRDRIVLFGVAVLLAALVFAWLDTEAATAPLRLLKESAERIAGGDLARRIEVRRADEIGALARSFEAMRGRLLHSLDEIHRRAEASQSLYHIGTEVLSLQDRDAVLQSVATRAASLLGGDIAVVCLIDESGRTATVQAAAGPGLELLRSTGPVAVSVGEDGLACAGCPLVDTTALKAHAAAPLVVAGRMVGALCVGAWSEGAFTPHEREVLGGLANLAAMAVENARLQERVLSMAVVDERERIAREMHDSVGQLLGYVNTKAQAVRVLLDVGKTGDAQTQLAQLEQASREIYADLREAILGLRAEVSPDRRLVPVLEEYVRRFSELSGLATELRVEGDPGRYALSPTTELHLIRIIQEALTNVRKHAMARRAWVQFSEQDGTLTVSVRDDGQGFDPDRGPGGTWPRFGMQTMRERAEAIGGTFLVRSQSGSGTEIVVRIPTSGRPVRGARPVGG